MGFRTVKFVMVLFLIPAVMWGCTKKEGEGKAGDMMSKEADAKTVSGVTVVIMKTSMGDVEIELNGDKAPETVKNFLKYVDAKFYDGTTFHRVIPTFMIQGGGFDPGMKPKQGFASIKNEANNGLTNARGTLAMARTQVIDSATSQFFINVVDNNFLNYRDSSIEGFGYCVFGTVKKGLDVVDKIRNVQTKTIGPFGDVPVKDVIIISIRRAEK
jgi:peptidyl-prolyl cis-trans isomerase B (cyclophilin B)